MNRKSTFQQRLEDIATMKGYNTNPQPKEEDTLKGLIKSIITILIETFLYPLVLMYIWDYIMPDLFNFKTITYWQMFLVTVMVNMIFRPVVGKRRY